MWKSAMKKTTITPIFTMLLFFMSLFFFFFTQDLKAEHRDFPTRSAVSSQCSVLSISSSLFNCQNPHLICVSREMIRLI